jgi:hypothetical protein
MEEALTIDDGISWLPCLGIMKKPKLVPLPCLSPTAPSASTVMTSPTPLQLALTLTTYAPTVFHVSYHPTTPTSGTTALLITPTHPRLSDRCYF